jgi:hypothetical protein
MVSADSARGTPIRSETQKGKGTASARVGPTVMANVKSFRSDPGSRSRYVESEDPTPIVILLRKFALIEPDAA